MVQGISDAESTADHSFSVTLASLILSELIEEPLDRAKLLTIALLHDLPESVIGDIPPSAAAYLPPKPSGKPRHRCWASY